MAAQLGLAHASRFPHAARAPGGRRAAAVRGPLGQPGLSPHYLDADFTRTTPTQVLFETTALWRAQYTIESPADGAGSPAADRRRRALPGGAPPHLHSAIAPSPSRGWSTRARATSCRGSSSHERARPPPSARTGARRAEGSPVTGTHLAPPAQALRARQLADDGVVEAFTRDGAVCLRGALSPDEVARLARGIDANLALPSPRAIVASRPTTPAASSRTSATGHTTRTTARSRSTACCRRWRRA
jgi:hypothetical protein